MRYFYLSRNALRDRNEVVLYDQFNMQVDINVYRTGLGKQDAIEYIGENIPNDIYYDLKIIGSNLNKRFRDPSDSEIRILKLKPKKIK